MNGIIPIEERRRIVHVHRTTVVVQIEKKMRFNAFAILILSCLTMTTATQKLLRNNAKHHHPQQQVYTLSPPSLTPLLPPSAQFLLDLTSLYSHHPSHFSLPSLPHQHEITTDFHRIRPALRSRPHHT